MVVGVRWEGAREKEKKGSSDLESFELRQVPTSHRF